MNFMRRRLWALRDPNDVFFLVDCYFHHTTHTDASNTNWWDLLHDLFGQWYCIREHSNRCYWDRSPPQQYWLFAMIICIQSSAAAASKNAQLSLKASQTVSIAQKTISKATQKSSQIWFPIMCKKKKTGACLESCFIWNMLEEMGVMFSYSSIEQIDATTIYATITSCQEEDTEICLEW